MALAVLLTGLGPSLLQAHSPQAHGFKLVTFRRPAPAPGFSLNTPQGTSLALDSLRGKVVLLNFWATWCPPCLKEMPSMEQLYQQFKAQGFTVVAVSTDKEGAAQVTPFVERLKVTFPILLDPDSALSKKYGARDLPSSFLINGKGQVIAAAKGERDWFSPGARSYLAELLQSR